MDDGVEQRGLVIAEERAPAGEHLEEDDAERPQVHARVDVAAELLRAHVRRRAERVAGPGEVGPGAPRDPEVEELGEAVLGEEDVRGLDVSVDDAAPVGGPEPPRDVGRDAGGVGDGERAALEAGRERLAVVARHREVEPAVVGLVRFVDRAEVGVVHGGDGVGLGEEPRARLRVGGEVGGEHLHGDEPVEPGVARAVDHAHRPPAKLLDQLVAPGEERGLLIGGRRLRGRLADGFAPCVPLEERLDLSAEGRILPAGAVQARLAPRRVQRHNLREEALDPAPPRPGREDRHR